MSREPRPNGFFDTVKRTFGLRSPPDQTPPPRAIPRQPAQTEVRAIPATNGFICYARADHELVATFRTYLAAVEEDCGIRFWQDPDLIAGGHWNDDIARAIQAAEVFLLLLSPAWRASTYIRDTELPAIRKRSVENGGLVIPVILSECAWPPIAGNLQAVPRNGRDILPIDLWAHEGQPVNRGHLVAVQAIEGAIRNRSKLAPTSIEWQIVLEPDRQNPAAPVWIEAKRQLVMDPKGDRTDAAAAAEPVTQELHEGTRALATTLEAKVRGRVGNHEDWSKLVGAVSAFVKDLAPDTDAFAGRLVPAWVTYNELASEYDRHALRLAEADGVHDPLPSDVAVALKESITVAGAFLHRFPLVRTFETASVPTGISDSLAQAIEDMLGAANANGLIPEPDAERLTTMVRQRLSGTEADGKAAVFAVQGVRNLLLKMGNFSAAAELGRWEPDNPNDAALLACIMTVLAQTGDRLAPLLDGYSTGLKLAFQQLIAIAKNPAARAPGVPSRQTRRPGTIVATELGNLQMAYIPDGQYMRGAEPAEQEREGVPEQYRGWEQPRRLVTIRQPFLLGRTPVTVGQFRRFVEHSGHKVPAGVYTWVQGKGWQQTEAQDWRAPGFPQTDDHPVTCVGPEDADAFVRWLSSVTKKDYRLPSEAEWEFACRAGTTTARFWGDDREGARKYANVSDLSLAPVLKMDPKPERFFQHDDGYPFTSTVAAFDPNPWGLYDMLGNVWEWMADDWFDSHEDADCTDTKRTTTGSNRLRVVRGASWFSGPWFVRSASRGRDGDRDTTSGFRLARTL